MSAAAVAATEEAEAIVGGRRAAIGRQRSAVVDEPRGATKHRHFSVEITDAPDGKMNGSAQGEYSRSLQQ
jgi:hypothetical protein